YSLTFDDSLSWCVIGGLGSGRDRHSSQSSESHSAVRPGPSAPPDPGPFCRHDDCVCSRR
ncbi:unnamed protein product, partial [Tetraodon nigroviridis]